MAEARELYEALKYHGLAELHTLVDVQLAYERLGEAVGVPYAENRETRTWNLSEMMQAHREIVSNGSKTQSIA